MHTVKWAFGYPFGNPSNWRTHLTSARFVSLRFATCTNYLEVDVRN